MTWLLLFSLPHLSEPCPWHIIFWLHLAFAIPHMCQIVFTLLYFILAAPSAWKTFSPLLLIWTYYRNTEYKNSGKKFASFQDLHIICSVQ